MDTAYGNAIALPYQRKCMVIGCCPVCLKLTVAARAALYARACEQHHARWARQTRDWTLSNEVYLNQERPALKKAA